MNYFRTNINPNIALATLEISEEGLLIIQPGGRVEAANTKASFLLNKSLTDLQSTSFEELFVFYKPEDHSVYVPEEIPFLNLSFPAAESKQMILGIKAENETYKWLSATIRTIPGKDSLPYFTVSLIDVTSFVEANKALKIKEQNLQLLVSSLDDIVFEVDMEGYILNCWTNDENRLFYDPEYIISKNIHELFERQLADSFLENIRKSIQNKETSIFEYPAPTSTNRIGWYKMQAKPIHKIPNRVAVVISDITQKVKGSERIRISEQKFNQAFQHSAIGMAIVDRNGYCIEVNQTLCDILGYSDKELREKPFPAFTYPDDRPKDEELLKPLLERKVDWISIEKRHVHKQGHIIWNLVTVSPICDKHNQPIFYVTQIQDLSLFKKQVDILAQQNEQLEITTHDLQSKICQLEEFNQIVAHNLRGPASNMQMLLEEILDVNIPQEKKVYLKLLEQSNRELLDILQELIQVLEIRSNQHIVRQDCKFEPALKKVKQQLSTNIHDRKAIITTDFQLKTINYPKLFLDSILQNLISNSLKYTAINTVPQIHISTYLKKGSPFLSIKDNGIGLDLNKYQSKLFGFKRIFHKGYDSKGTGLFMIKYLIETFGGKIHVESEPGKGSLFTIEFFNSTKLINTNGN